MFENIKNDSLDKDNLRERLLSFNCGENVNAILRVASAALNKRLQCGDFHSISKSFSVLCEGIT